jgi:hypothetical protein
LLEGSHFMVKTLLLVAVAWTQPNAPQEAAGTMTISAPARSVQTAAPAGMENFGLSAAPAVATQGADQSAYRATVTSYLQEAAPPAPPPPVPVAPVPGEVGLSTAAAQAAPASAPVPQPAPCCNGANGCNGNGNGYVNGLYSDAYCNGDDGCRCKNCLSRLKSHCALCELHSTCDLIPHYPYYPMQHGYYYFRPYNHTSIQVDQQTAVRLGADTRNPYSVLTLDNLFAHLPRTPQKTATHVRPQGPDLEKLENLLDPKPVP